MTSTMNRRVSFNKEIDVRVFTKNSKNTKLIESYLQPLTATPLPCEPEVILTSRSNSTASTPIYLTKQSNGKYFF